MSKRPHPIAIAWLPAAILLALAGNASAQDTSAPSPAKARQLSAVIVTGTRADNRTESSSLTPIDVVSAKVLQQTGTSELSTALARIIPSLTFPRPSAADTADSQRPAQLRGLSPDQVLVLVDGKRWHRVRSSSPTACSGAARRPSISTPYRWRPSTTSRCCATAHRRNTAPTRSPA